MIKECKTCGMNDEECGCNCPHYDKWYACPFENKKPENIQALKDYAESMKLPEANKETEE